MSDPQPTLAVMFVDICNSTRLFAEHGDEYALALISRCLASINACVTQHEGQIVQRLGDGVLCTFPSADAAVAAALATAHPALAAVDLALHGGIHFGPVIVTPESVYGDAVNLTKRLADLADEHEFILSQAVRSQLSPGYRRQLRPLGTIPVKSKPQVVNIYLLGTRAKDITAVTSNILLPAPPPPALTLYYRSHTRQIDDASAEFVLGRQETCDLIVDNHYTSRRHATIESKRGKFLLIDHSTNGSYVVDDKQQLIILKRDFLQLYGSGVISLGSEPQRNPEHLIRYQTGPNVA